MMCYDTSLEDLKRKKSQKPTWRPWSFWPRGTEQLENLSRLHCIWIPSTIGVLSRGQEKIEANQSLPPYTPLLFTAIYRGHLHQIDWHFWLLEAPCILPLKIGSCSANWESNRILLHYATLIAEIATSKDLWSWQSRTDPASPLWANSSIVPLKQLFIRKRKCDLLTWSKAHWNETDALCCQCLCRCISSVKKRRTRKTCPCHQKMSMQKGYCTYTVHTYHLPSCI